MYCGACGQENPGEQNYCSGCGKPLRAATLPPQQTLEPPDNKKYSVILTAAPQYDLDRFFAIRQLAATRLISEKESTLLVENAPSIVASVGSVAEAENIQKALEPLGLTLVIRPYGREELETLAKTNRVSAEDRPSQETHSQMGSMNVVERISGVIIGVPLLVAGFVGGFTGISSCFTIVGVLWGIPIFIIGAAAG